MLDRIGLKEKSYDITATEAERAALAKRLGIPSVNSFDAKIGLRLTGERRHRQAVGPRARRTDADLRGDAGAPFTQQVDEDFTRLYSVEADDEAEEVVIEMDEDDGPIRWIDGQIDMGEAAAEHLALGDGSVPEIGRMRPSNRMSIPSRNRSRNRHLAFRRAGGIAQKRIAIACSPDRFSLKGLPFAIQPS